VSLTPYDTGDRLEPQPWQVQPRNLPDAEEAARYGKVDFDNEESATFLTAYVERNEDRKGYTLHANFDGEGALTVNLSVEGEEALLLQPSAALQEKVQRTIAELRTSYEQEVAEVYWQHGQAVIVVPGEKHVRKQQIILVSEDSFTMSAKAGTWTNGVRDTRIG
jgi:hypothetical protein